MEKVFCDCIGVKEGGFFDKCIISFMKCIWDLFVFYVINVIKDGYDFIK